MYILPYSRSLTRDLAAGPARDVPLLPPFLRAGPHFTSVKLTGVILPAFRRLQWKLVQQGERLMVGKHVRKHNAENTTLRRELFVLLFERAQDLAKGV